MDPASIATVIGWILAVLRLAVFVALIVYVCFFSYMPAEFQAIHACAWMKFENDKTLHPGVTDEELMVIFMRECREQSVKRRPGLINQIFLNLLRKV